MQLNQQGVYRGKKQVIINEVYNNDNDHSTSTKSIKQKRLQSLKSISLTGKQYSPLNELMQIKNIKNEQFLFRMRLKFIACMQQLQIGRQEIELLRSQQTDSGILSSFINPIKRQFSELKKVKDQHLLGQDTNSLSRQKSSKNIQSLQIISLESQLQQIVQSQKKMRIKSQRLFIQNSQLQQKLKRKQLQYEQSENNNYKIRLMLKQYESVIQNMKLSIKKGQRDFINQKQRIKQQVNGLGQLLTRQRQGKLIYSSKLQQLQTLIIQKQQIIRRLSQQIQYVKKQCIKWKSRTQWRQSEQNNENKSRNKIVKQLQNEIQRLNEIIKKKQVQLQILNRQRIGQRDIFNNKLQKIVQQWKIKLISNVQEYQQTIQNYLQQIQQQKQKNQKYKQSIQQYKLQSQKYKQLIQKQKQQIQKSEKQNIQLKTKISQQYQPLININKSISQQLFMIQQKNKQVNQKYQQTNNKYQQINNKYQQLTKKYQQQQKQIKQINIFYNKKINQLQSIIIQLKSQNQNQSLSINHINNKNKLLQYQIIQTNQSIQSLNNQLITKSNQYQNLIHSIQNKQIQIQNISKQIKSQSVQIINKQIQFKNKQIQIKNILQTKKQTQNQLLKRISSTQNNRIIEISKLKVYYQELINTLNHQITNLKNQLITLQQQHQTPNKITQFNSNIKLTPTFQQPNLQSSLSSSYNSVNNSINTNISNQNLIQRTNKLISQTYAQPQRNSSIRRVFVRSNSINQYLKENGFSNMSKQTTISTNNSQQQNLLIQKKE